MGRSPEFGFVFVPVDGITKPKRASHRQLIRSHCMLGKNRTIGVPKRSVHSSKPNHRLDSLDPFPHTAVRWEVTPPNTDVEKTRCDTGNVILHAEQIPLPASLSSMPLMQFAFDINHRSKRLIFHFIDTTIKLMYPQNLGVAMDPKHAYWFQWLAQDAAYLQCALFSTSVAEDFSKNRPVSSASFTHLSKAISLLNRALSQKDGSVDSLSDSTITIVFMLATFASMMGDHASAVAHAHGLRQMVRLRGGLDSLRSNAKLCIQLGRIGLAYALDEEQDWLLSTSARPHRPRFYDDYVALPYNSGIVTTSTYKMLDPLIWPVFYDVQVFASALNDKSATKPHQSEVDFQTEIFSLHYRLIQLEGSLQGLTSECIRLAMLALLTTTLQLPGTRTAYPRLADQLRHCCQAIDVSHDDKMQRLIEWVLLVGAVSVFDVEVERSWMQETWLVDVSSVATWEGKRKDIKKYIWIDGLHDNAGKKAFKALSVRRDTN